MRSLKALFLIALLGAALSKTCGEGPAVQSFENDVIKQIQNLDPISKASWDSWKASNAVDIAQGKAPAVCKDLFTGKKTCCKDESLSLLKTVYQSFLNDYLSVGGSFMGLGAKKGFKGDKLQGELFPILMKCSLAFLQKHPELAKSSGSDMMSGSVSESEGEKKIKKAMDDTEKKAKSILKKALAELGLASLRLFRGTQCALCQDPDTPIEQIWKNGAVQVKDSDVNDIQAKVKKLLTDSVEGAKLSYLAVRAELEGSLKFMECQEGLDLIAKRKPEEQYCKDDAACQSVADAAVTSAWVIKNDGFVSDNPTGRVLQGNSLAASPNGVAGQTTDPEDNTIVTVDGQSVDQIDNDIQTADSDLKANPVNLEAQIGAVPNGSSVIISAFMMFVAVVAFMF